MTPFSNYYLRIYRNHTNPLLFIFLKRPEQFIGMITCYDHHLSTRRDMNKSRVWLIVHITASRESFLEMINQGYPMGRATPDAAAGRLWHTGFSPGSCPRAWYSCPGSKSHPWFTLYSRHLQSSSWLHWGSRLWPAKLLLFSLDERKLLKPHGFWTLRT